MDVINFQRGYEMVLDMLSNEINKLVEERGWEDLTEAQKLAIPEIIKGKNVLIIAPTGLGKTEAAILPILDMMLKENVKPVALLYITPLRALINDIALRLEWWASRLGFRVARKHGDVPSSEKAQRLRRVPHILITTPESLEIDLDWASRFRDYYKNIRWVVIDEVHELLQSKRGIQLAILLERLKDLTKRDFQRICLSATVKNPKLAADFMLGSSSRERAIIEAEAEKKIVYGIDYVDDRDEDLWINAAKAISKSIEPPSLIFVNSRFTAERLHEVLEKLGMKDIFVHHSSVSRSVRVDAERMLKEGKLNAVVCTKTLELGIDVGEVKKVIQFRPPGSVTTLIQRIGRSGHKAKEVSKGVIINIGPLELLESLASSMLAAKKIMEEPIVINCPLDVLARAIMGMCMQKPGIRADHIYNIVKGAYPYRNLDVKVFKDLIEYLVRVQLISRSDGRLKLGPTFFKIWSFNSESATKKWWVRGFPEFFSTIGERDSFTVKCKGKVIGDVDSYFVYRYLRVGDAIRLSGRLWRVVEIDDNVMRIEVIPADNGEGEVPMWRGEGIRRSSLLAQTVEEVLDNLRNDRLKLPEDVIIDLNIVKHLKSFIKEQEESKVPFPRKDLMVIERCGDETFFLYWMGQNVAETLAHIISYAISTSITLNVATRSSYAGFSVKARGVDPLKILLNLDPDRIPHLAEEAVRRSPLTYAMLRDIQVSFGKTGRIDPREDKLLIEEAKKQTLNMYFDVEGAVEFVRKLKDNEIEIVEVKSREPSPLAKMISKLPAQRPWVKDASIIIVHTLEGSAFTADELAEILELPARTIENMLKDMRKPESKDRVFQFMDVDLGEWRWALVKDAAKVFNSEEFRSSFIPYDKTEAYMLMIKPESGESYYTKYFTPKEILESMERFIENLPVKEAYEVRVMPLYDSLLKSLAPKYYHVPVEAMPYVALNGVVILQKLRLSS